VNNGLTRRAWLYLGAASLGAAAAATLAPLATYAFTLAAFGLVHVLTELRYVDRRFSPRLPFGLTAAWLLIIGLIMALRIGRIVLGGEWPYAKPAELLLVAALAIGGLIALRRATWPRRLVAGGVIGALLYGAWAAPVTTLILLAVLHNLTPIGFLVERFRGPGRAAWLVGAALLFVGVPLVIASGGTQALVSSLGISPHAGGPLGTGVVQDHAAVFLPTAWVSTESTRTILNLFAAAAYLQCLHYAVVIGILPRLEPGDVDPAAVYVRWPSRRLWIPALCVVAGVSFAVFAWSFRDARTFYGLFALVHAWIEVPVLIAALAPLRESA